MRSTLRARIKLCGQEAKGNHAHMSHATGEIGMGGYAKKMQIGVQELETSCFAHFASCRDALHHHDQGLPSDGASSRPQFGVQLRYFLTGREGKDMPCQIAGRIAACSTVDQCLSDPSRAASPSACFIPTTPSSGIFFKTSLPAHLPDVTCDKREGKLETWLSQSKCSK